MKFIELKDITNGYEFVVAWKDYYDYWRPIKVKIKKFKKIEIINLENNDLISIMDIIHSKKGKDINNKLIIEIGIFNSLEECQKICDFENRIL